MKRLVILLFLTIVNIHLRVHAIEYSTNGLLVSQSDYSYSFTTTEMRRAENALVESYEMVGWDTMWPSYEKDGSTTKKFGDFRTYIDNAFQSIDKLQSRLQGRSLWIDYYVKRDGSIICKAIKTYEYDLLNYASDEMIKQMIKVLCEYKFKEASVKENYCLHLHTVVSF